MLKIGKYHINPLHIVYTEVRNNAIIIYLATGKSILFEDEEAKMVISWLDNASELRY